MIKKLIASLLKRKLYKAEVLITDEDFTAEFYSDSLNECVTWILAGISESFATSNNKKSMTRGIYGRVSKFSILNFDKNTIKINEYKEPPSREYLFMTDAMVYVPDSIMRKVGNESTLPIQMLK
tara:strand:- start:699 stop:1070 length:372 start_codon:yes stop_codon:yes gene_type:complete